jgi:23S rRNA pseudouridine1911/1915/1917 synthase
MMRREVDKEYRAIVWGWPESDAFTVDQPIVRRHDIEPCEIYNLQQVHPEGAASCTEFRVLERFEKQTPNGSRFSLLAAKPLTGRMHQIRVHVSHAGFPVVGDKLYGPSPEWYVRQIHHGWTPEAAETLLMRRQALHSCHLSVTTDDGRLLAWNAEIPPDMAQFLTGKIWA